MTSSFITDVPASVCPQVCHLYAFRHDTARQNRLIDPVALSQLLGLKTEAQRRLNQYTDAAIRLEPDVNRLRRWAKVGLCEWPDEVGRAEGTRLMGMIVPELIIHALISEGKLCPRPRRLAYSGYCPITPIKRPEGHPSQTTVFVELLNDECRRLGLTALQRRFAQLSATLMEASARERFALVCFHALLRGDIDTVFGQSAVTLSVLMSSYLVHHPALQGPVEEYLFFAFYSTWLSYPPVRG
ncbi:hypothetical protein [Budvicia aquatica]|uniref:Uncharacterized protein n=2 Tax=Budvicia aquatica TaxID=82979 RepID=A0A2C6DLE8_9GAMM|nr:hypothetical protein [Budvicia aquatica]PHI29162.1 hypothetical protein CRN84_07425 [Budvicia aquatica]